MTHLLVRLDSLLARGQLQDSSLAFVLVGCASRETSLSIARISWPDAHTTGFYCHDRPLRQFGPALRERLNSHGTLGADGHDADDAAVRHVTNDG